MVFTVIPQIAGSINIGSDRAVVLCLFGDVIKPSHQQAKVFMTSEVISERASVLLKTLVQRHIRDGQPVGSRTLVEEAGLPVSAATIRNVMSDLEERGYVVSPHTSAGRIPTAMGYRLFVDSLLQVQPLESEAVSVLRNELNPDKSATELIQSASSLLSSITAQAGLVTVPRQEAGQ